jgi:hypothetical protein
MLRDYYKIELMRLKISKKKIKINPFRLQLAALQAVRSGRAGRGG